MKKSKKRRDNEKRINSTGEAVLLATRSLLLLAKINEFSCNEALKNNKLVVRLFTQYSVITSTKWTNLNSPANEFGLVVNETVPHGF